MQYTRVITVIAASAVALGAWAGLIRADASASAQEPLTYSKQIARLLQQRCETCHRADGVAPFALSSYDQAKKFAKTIRKVVAERRMPPWHADPRYGRFTNHRGLSDAEIRQVTEWVDAGTPEGARADLPPAAQYQKGWTIGKPDVVIEMPKEYEVPAEGVIDYQRFVVDPGFKQDVWVERAEARPGSRAVHHILVFALLPGRTMYDFAGNTPVICGTAPGDMPLILPEGYAKKIPAGARLLFEVHYTPIGKPERDRSSIALIYAKKPPRSEVLTNILAKADIRIPPGAADHREQQSFSFPSDIRVLSLMPHMHVRGKSFEYRVVHPDGKYEVLLSVPRYDFKWQSAYRFADPPLIAKGDRLECRAAWDNSASNPVNPDASRTVSFGLQTWDEMMNGWIDYVVVAK